MKHAVYLLASLLALLASGTPALGAAAPEVGPGALSVCLAEANPPFSGSDLPAGGIDAELARGIAQALGREVRLAWVTIARRGGLGKALRQNFAAGACDLFTGIPASGAPDEELAEQRLTLSDAYLSTGYAFVGAAPGSAFSLDEARRGGRIGVLSATPADLYLYRQGLNRVPYGSNRDLLAALAERSVAAVLIWMPALAEARRQGLAPGAGRPPLPAAGLETRFVIAVAPQQPALQAELRRALAQLRGDGSLAAILHRHGMAP